MQYFLVGSGDSLKAGEATLIRKESGKWYYLYLAPPSARGWGKGSDHDMTTDGYKSVREVSEQEATRLMAEVGM